MLSSVSLHCNSVIGVDDTGSPVIVSCVDMEWSSTLDQINKVDLIIRDPKYIHHYFHFAELSIAIITTIFTYMPKVKIDRVYFGLQSWNNPNQNLVQQDIIQALFSPARIIEGEPDGDDKYSRFSVLLADRCGPIDAYYNKYIASVTSQARHVFPIFRSKALDFAAKSQTRLPSDGKLRALYVKRGPPRTFSPGLEEQFLQRFSDHGITLELIDFSGMTWSDQVIATSQARLMVGIHGNGLTNCLWMPPGAALIEIFPADVHHYDYQMLAEVAGLNYFGVEGRAQNPFVFTSGSRFDAPYGVVSEPVTELPWHWIDQILAGLNLNVPL